MHVLSNLIENAVKFSDDGPITISGEVSGACAIVEVADRGVGIPADLIGDIFSGPGPRAGKATPLGTGLGLYLSKRVMELHGGDITVESTDGEGSVFRMSVPLHGDDV
jgi:signal transduction histidine kinase